MDEPKAFIFDLNGTMVDDMAYHLDVWHDIIVGDHAFNMTRSELKQHMFGKSQELLVRIFGKPRFTDQELDKISFEKERRYQHLYRPHLDLIPGLFAFLETAWESKIKMAIGSAAIRPNIDFVIDNLKIRHYFDAIVSAEDVRRSKPDPETFLKAAYMLNVDPESCVVFEDAPKGVECARNSGMNAVVLTTMHDKGEFAVYDNVIDFIDDYTNCTPGFVQQYSTIFGLSQKKNFGK
jgi:beta-phosphoglucomutase